VNGNRIFRVFAARSAVLPELDLTSFPLSGCAIPASLRLRDDSGSLDFPKLAQV